MQSFQSDAGDGVAYAGFFTRLAAYLIDLAIVWTALLAVRAPLWLLSLIDGDGFLIRDIVFSYSIKDMLLYVLSAMYFILLTYFTGSTLGKKLLNIRVESVYDRRTTFFEIAYRETVGRFLSKIVFVGYILIGIDEKKRGLHDFLSDTRVVYNSHA